MCIPIESGVCADGVYSIQRWIDGEDAEDNSIVWCIPKAPLFAASMVNGYFDNAVKPSQGDFGMV